MRQYFWLNREILQISILNILTGQKRDMTELKLVWPVNMTGHRLKIILSPETYLRRHVLVVDMSNYSNCPNLRSNKQIPFDLYSFQKGPKRLFGCSHLEVVKIRQFDISFQRNKLYMYMCSLI